VNSGRHLIGYRLAVKTEGIGHGAFGEIPAALGANADPGHGLDTGIEGLEVGSFGNGNKNGFLFMIENQVEALDGRGSNR